MSDHLIAEANRHAKALTDERNNLVVELNLLREWQREVIQNARAHHAQLKDAIARAERAEASLHALRLVCGTTDADKFTTWVDRANARAEKAEAQSAAVTKANIENADAYRLMQGRVIAAEAQLAAEREKVRALRLACERIVEQWDKNHDAAPFHAGNVMYSRASAALATTEDAQ
jgi:hypothetical protein